MKPVTQYPIPDSAEEYGDERFVTVEEIYYDPDFERVTVLVEDPDSADGFYQYFFSAERGDGNEILVEDGNTVGVPEVGTTPHTTIADVLDDIDNITFVEDL